MNQKIGQTGFYQQINPKMWQYAKPEVFIQDPSRTFILEYLDELLKEAKKTTQEEPLNEEELEKELLELMRKNKQMLINKQITK